MNPWLCMLHSTVSTSRQLQMLGSTSRSESCGGQEYGNITSEIPQRVLLALSTCSGEMKAHSLKERDCPLNTLASPNHHTGHTTKHKPSVCSILSPTPAQNHISHPVTCQNSRPFAPGYAANSPTKEPSTASLVPLHHHIQGHARQTPFQFLPAIPGIPAVHRCTFST